MSENTVATSCLSRVGRHVWGICQELSTWRVKNLFYCKKSKGCHESGQPWSMSFEAGPLFVALKSWEKYTCCTRKAFKGNGTIYKCKVQNVSTKAASGRFHLGHILLVRTFLKACLQFRDLTVSLLTLRGMRIESSTPSGQNTIAKLLLLSGS